MVSRINAQEPMTQHRAQSAQRRLIVAKLAQTPRIEDVGGVAARFVYSLRLIALHERARRDPVPELAARLGSVDVAAKALALSQAIASSWPENIQLSRFCCGLLTPDEATIGKFVDAVCDRDRAALERAVEGFVRHDRIHRLWDATLALVLAEHRNG